MIVEPIEFGLVIQIRTTITKSFVKHFLEALSKILDTLESLEAKNLNRFVQNKSIQKAIESRKIKEDKKEYLRTLKIWIFVMILMK